MGAVEVSATLRLRYTLYCSALRFLLMSRPVRLIPSANSELGSGTGETCVVNAKSELGLTLNPDENSNPPEYGFVLLYQ